MRIPERPGQSFEFRSIYRVQEKTMSSIVLRFAILAVGISLAVYVVPGIDSAGYGPIIEAALILGLLNLVIKPVLFILTLPINILSLGLFSFIINGLMLMLVGYLVGGLHVASFGVAILGSIVISIFSMVTGWLVR
ncbi:MAG: phage holin family protein [Thermodesulfobacteriota bacterium]